MVYLTFYWNTWAIFENDEIFRMIQREDYEAESWQECCDKCISCFDWDDSDLIKGFEEKTIETNRQLKEISMHNSEEEGDAPKEIYDYIQNHLINFEKTKFKSIKKN